jgi:hypothetical protein
MTIAGLGDRLDLEEIKVSGSLDVVELPGSLDPQDWSLFRCLPKLYNYNYLLLIILYCCYDFHRICRCSDGYFNLVYQTHSSLSCDKRV